MELCSDESAVDIDHSVCLIPYLVS